IRLPCPSTSTMSLSLAPCRTSCSAAPAMKSATTASTAIPHPSMKMPVCPVATKLVRCPRLTSASRNCSCAVILPTLQSDPTARTTRASTSAARPPARVENANAASFGERTQLRIVADEGVQPAPDLELLLDRGAEPTFPFVGQPAARRGDPDQYRGRALPLRETTLEVADDGNLAAESEYLLRRLPRLLAVEHRHDALGEIADAGVRRLRREGTELTIRDDQETMLRRRHFLTATCRRSTPDHAPLARRTAGLKRPGSS